MIHHRYKIAVYLLALIALCDQLSKWWILNASRVIPDHPLAVGPFFNLVIVRNRGMTFGLLNTLDAAWVTYALVAVAGVIIFLLGRWLWLTSSTMVAVGLGAIMGGAIGNVIDRLRYGAVVDFLDFYYRNHHWPAFNLADASICTGVALLMLDSLIRAR